MLSFYDEGVPVYYTGLMSLVIFNSNYNNL